LASGKQQYKLINDFYLNGLVNVLSEEKVPVVFGGYGIEDDKYDDYKGIDVKDKAVLIFEGEPKNSSGNFVINGNDKPSQWGKDDNAWMRKVSLARQKGAKYVLIVSELEGEAFTQQIKRRTAMSQRFNRLSTKPSKESTNGNSAFVINRAIALDLLGISSKKLTKLQKNISKTGKSTAGSIKEHSIALKAERVDEVVTTENVVGYLEGTDKKDEVIIVTAHIDHIGISSNGEINNGADDDGSGTVTVLELAEAFAKAKAEGNGPRRSMLFMLVTGEEKGLWGSEYYVSNPIFPLKQTVCDLNIDMIGRIDKEHANNPDYVYIIGSDKLSSDLHKINEDANAKNTQLALDYTYNDSAHPERFYYRSDHYNFAKNKIPVVFYFTGVHEDYHRPTDDVDKILFGKQSKIAKLVFFTAWELANREERIKVDSNKP
jgi:hypothetical protein